MPYAVSGYGLPATSPIPGCRPRWRTMFRTTASSWRASISAPGSRSSLGEISEPRRQAAGATPCSPASPRRRWTLAMPRRVVRTGTRLLRPWPKISNFRPAATFTSVASRATVRKNDGATNRKELTMNVAMKSIAAAPPPRSDPAPTPPGPSTREIIGTLPRELREEVGGQAVEPVVAANPLVGLDRSQTLAAGTRVLGRALLDPAQLARRLGGLLREVALVLA